jgi:chemotaxis protein methyltransferase WspC
MDAAAGMLDRLAATSGPTPGLFYLRGVLSEALGRADLAEAAYRKALYLDPAHHESLAQLSLLLELGGRAEVAARMRRRAANLLPQ